MKALGWMLVAALAIPGRAAAPTTREFSELPPGRYTIAVTGLLSTVCARAISSEWAKLPEVESASVDFEKSSATVSVRLDRTLKVALLRKTLRRAEKVANLGVHYDMLAITYRLGR